VEQTTIPANLEHILMLLQQEELECERGMYGPCLEYLLQHKLLDTLYSLARTDVGVMKYIYSKTPLNKLP